MFNVPLNDIKGRWSLEGVKNLIDARSQSAKRNCDGFENRVETLEVVWGFMSRISATPVHPTEKHGKSSARIRPRNIKRDNKIALNRY